MLICVSHIISFRLVKDKDTVTEPMAGKVTCIPDEFMFWYSKQSPKKYNFLNIYCRTAWITYFDQVWCQSSTFNRNEQNYLKLFNICMTRNSTGWIRFWLFFFLSFFFYFFYFLLYLVIFLNISFSLALIPISPAYTHLFQHLSFPLWDVTE